MAGGLTSAGRKRATSRAKNIDCVAVPVLQSVSDVSLQLNILNPALLCRAHAKSNTEDGGQLASVFVLETEKSGFYNSKGIFTRHVETRFLPLTACQRPSCNRNDRPH